MLIHCTVNGKLESTEISEKLHEALCDCRDTRPLHEIVRDAWQKYGVSAEAIRRYLQEIERRP